jgi:hypothetical protein
MGSIATSTTSPAPLTALSAVRLCGLDYADKVAHLEVSNLPGTARVVSYEGRMICICQGSTTFTDWLSNIRVLPTRIRAQMLSYMEDEEVASGVRRRWHRGFLREAERVWYWLHRLDIAPDFIVGHSRGGGVGQILCFSYRCPGIFFASPHAAPPTERLPLASSVYHVRNVADAVGYVPLGWQSYGTEVPVRLQSAWRPSARHSIGAYVDALETHRIPNISVRSA